METRSASPRQQLLTWWVLWAAFQVGICVIYHFLHQPSPPVPDGSSHWMLASLPALMSTFLRWGVLPRLSDPLKALPLIVVGIAMAEATGFIGMFVFPAHQWELFLAAAVGIAQWMPVYAGRFFAPPDEGAGPS